MGKPIPGDGDPTDELFGPPHSEPDADDTMDKLAGADIFGGGDEGDLLGGTNPLEEALENAGFPNISPEQMTQIEAILKQKPAAPAPGGAPMGGKLPGNPLPAPKATGGAVPASMPKGMPSR
jgi:hypothetical protein